MVIIAKENFHAWGPHNLAMFTGEIADVEDNFAQQLIYEGKAYKYDYEEGPINVRYVKALPEEGDPEVTYMLESYNYIVGHYDTISGEFEDLEGQYIFADFVPKNPSSSWEQGGLYAVPKGNVIELWSTMSGDWKHDYDMTVYDSMPDVKDAQKGIDFAVRNGKAVYKEYKWNSDTQTYDLVEGA